MFQQKLLVLFFLFEIVLSFSDDPLVELPNGKILGRKAVTFANTSYYSFKKIPYATPPIGELRFKAPQPAQTWEGVLDADTIGTSCFQLQGTMTTFDSEDCLFVNVFTPQLPDGTSNISLPVMLYIHGGAFLSGSSLFAPPDLFIDSGVVFVNINYRLGLFGFLSTQDEVIPGNNGLKDQVLAIQWTHQNIHLFGGDPDKITVFGESAGSSSVAYQILNQNSEGLFRAVIMESGTSICPWSYQRHARDIAFNFVTYLNSSFEDNDDSGALLEYLQSLDGTELNAAAEKYLDEEFDNGLGLVFAPVIEVKHSDAFITKKMYGLLQAGNVLRVPTLMGFNSEESLLFNQDPEALQGTLHIYDQNLDLLVPEDMRIGDEDRRTEMARQIRDLYTDGEPFGTNLGAAIRYSTDNSFVRSIVRHAELFSKLEKTYFYEFSYDGQLGNFDVHYDGAGNVAHAEELGYIFCSGEQCDDQNYPENDQVTRKRLVKIWTNFAKYLNPTPEASDLLQNITWPQVSTDDGDFLYVDINENLEIKNHPRDETYGKWIDLYDSLEIADFDTY